MLLSDGTVVLRPPTLDDADEVVAAIRSSLAEVSPWLTWATEDYGVADHCDWVMTSAQRGDYPLLICDPAGAVIGSVGLNQIDRLNSRANLGYWVHSARSGQGIATRAAALTARWAVEGLGFARIEIVMSVENSASRAVAERLGAYHEGVLRSALDLHGRRHDAHLYSLVAPEVRAWPRDGENR